MQSRRYIKTPSRPREALQDDSWLNDIGPAIQETMGADDPTVPLNRERMRPAIKSSSTVRMNDLIGFEHPLWPAMLHISELIWQELHHTSDDIDLSEPALIESVRKRAVALLRTEPAARQIHGLTEASLLLRSIVNDVLGSGPLKPLLQDQQITEVVAIGPRHTCIKRDGSLEEVPYYFADERHMRRIIANLLLLAGQRLRQNGPITEAYLPDGALVIVAMPPSVVNGPVLTIRKRISKPLTMPELVANGTLSGQMADFLQACVRARLNMLICGNVGAGKTTLLNALCSFIPEQERIVTIEEVSELSLRQKHVIRLVLNLANSSNLATDTVCNLVMRLQHLRPDRIIVGECRGNEAAELLQAMYSGNRGMLTTMYAMHMRDCFTRLETLCIAGGMNIPVPLLRSQLSCALDVVIYLSQQPDGAHKIINIAEVRGIDPNGAIKLQSLFHYRDGEADEEGGRTKGGHEPSGICPTFLPKLEALGMHISCETFGTNTRSKKSP